MGSETRNKATAGYSGKSVAQKLGIKPAFTIQTHNAPAPAATAAPRCATVDVP